MLTLVAWEFIHHLHVLSIKDIVHKYVAHEIILIIDWGKQTLSKDRLGLNNLALLCLTEFFRVISKKLWTTEIFMEGYCVVRKKPIRYEKTKPQTAKVISLWFWGLLACPELYCVWSLQNQQSWNFSRLHGFLSLTGNSFLAQCITLTT